MAKWADQLRAGCFEVWQPQAPVHTCAGCVALGAPSTQFRAQSVVQGASQPKWWPVQEDDDHRSRSETAGCAVEIRERRRRHRRSSPDKTISVDCQSILTICRSDQAWQILGRRTDETHGLKQPPLKNGFVSWVRTRRKRDHGTGACALTEYKVDWVRSRTASRKRTRHMDLRHLEGNPTMPM